MTDILPPAGWPNVRQLETNEFATGGANGNMNEQAKSLASQNMYARLYASLPFDQNFANQVGGFPVGGSVRLANGDIVRSVVAGNTNDPDINMTGWVISNNDISLSVKNISDLRLKTGAKDGMVIRTIGHTKSGIGSGVYVFEALSSKIDNNGSYIASSVASGTWVLISPLCFENFGVTDEAVDQSAKMQECMDFADSVKILNYGFRDIDSCYLGSSIIFKPLKLTDLTNTYSSNLRLVINTNGCVLKCLNNDITLIKIHRENVSFDCINGDYNNKTGCTALQLGLSPTESEYTAEYRRSASLFKCTDFKTTGLAIGVSFFPGSLDELVVGIHVIFP